MSIEPFEFDAPEWSDLAARERLRAFNEAKRAREEFIREHGNRLIDEGGYSVADLYLREYPDRIEIGVTGQVPAATLRR